MGDLQRIFSPDQRFFILLSSYEVRMSHWITSAALWEAAPERELLPFGNAWWSTDQVAWSDDGSCVTATLRRYPGDVPAIQLDFFPRQRSVVSRPPADAAAIAFEGLEQYLEAYYEARTRPLPTQRRRR